MSDDLELQKRLAADVLGSLAEMPPLAVRLLASALELSGGVFESLGRPIDYFADTREDPDLTDHLAVLALSRSLRLLARDPEVLERLEGADGPPWAALRNALEELRAEDGD